MAKERVRSGMFVVDRSDGKYSEERPSMQDILDRLCITSETYDLSKLGRGGRAMLRHYMRTEENLERYGLDRDVLKDLIRKGEYDEMKTVLYPQDVLRLREGSLGAFGIYLYRALVNSVHALKGTGSEVLDDFASSMVVSNEILAYNRMCFYRDECAKKLHPEPPSEEDVQSWMRIYSRITANAMQHWKEE